MRKPSKEEAPVKAPAGGGVGQGTTPVATTTTIDTAKDVVTAPSPIIQGGLGYGYTEYSYLPPIEYMPQVLVRVIKLSADLVHRVYGDTSDPVTVVNSGAVKQFWLDLPQLLLDKVLKRDGIRFLPDSFDNAGILQPLELLKVAARMELLTVRTLIDTASWNKGTSYLRGSFANKNRRCLECENNLATIEAPVLWAALGLSEPVISPRAGGPILITLVDMYSIVTQLGSVDGSHPAFVNKLPTSNPEPYRLIDSSSDIDALLGECENAIRLLRNQDTKALDGNSSAGFTWTAGTGRGIRADAKYIGILETELHFPAMGPLPGSGIVVDLGRYNQKLYGEAIYGWEDEHGLT